MFTAAPKSSHAESDSDDEIEDRLTIDEADENDNDDHSSYNKNTSRLFQADVPTNPKSSQSVLSSRCKSVGISPRKSCNLLNETPVPAQTGSLDEKNMGVHDTRRSKRLQSLSKTKGDSMKPQATEASSPDGKIGILAERVVTRSKRLDLLSSNDNDVHSLKGKDVKEKDTPCPISKTEYCKDDFSAHISKHTEKDKKPEECDSAHNVFTYNSSVISFQTEENLQKHCTKDLEGGGVCLENSITQIGHPRKKKNKRVSSKKKMHTCKQCDLPFTTLTLLNKHNKTSHNLNRVRFRRKQSQFLVNKKCNENLSHDGKQAKTFKCTECNLELKNEILLCKHLYKIHNICQFSCKHCSKVFSRKDSLLSHRLTHLKAVTAADGSKGVVTIPQQTQRIFKCDKCTCEFHKWDSFKKHTKIRHGVNSVCDVCCTTYGSREELDAHMAGHDWNKMDELDSLHECEVCHSLFLTPFKLKRHMVRH